MPAEPRNEDAYIAVRRPLITPHLHVADDSGLEVQHAKTENG
jgi:hypothetical protein